jgi:hypothetical protein
MSENLPLQKTFKCWWKKEFSNEQAVKKEEQNATWRIGR